MDTALPTIRYRVDGADTTFSVLSYDLAKRRIVRVEEPDRIWTEFVKSRVDWQLWWWHNGDKDRQRLLSVTVTDDNLFKLEKWLLEQGDQRAAWKVRALFPKTFFFDYDALHRRIAKRIAQSQFV